MKIVDTAIVQALSAAAHHLQEAERLSADPSKAPRTLHAAIKRAAADALRFAENAPTRTDPAPAEATPESPKRDI